MYESQSYALFLGALGAYFAASLFYFFYLSFRAKWAGQIATVIALLGLIGHAGSIGFRWASTWADRGWHMPFTNMYEYTSFFAFVIMLTYLIIEVRKKTKIYGGLAAGISFILMGVATIWYNPPGPIPVALQSYWLDIHVLSMVISSGVLGVAFVFAMLYMAKERKNRKLIPAMAGGAGSAKVAAPPIEKGFLSRFPEAKILDHLSYRTIALGFPIWTIGVIAGAIWAEQAWGRYWGWDPKETWSLITWLIYAGYLHSRVTVGWRGHRAALLATLGFLAVLFTFFAVNLWISGLHSYAS